MLTARSLTPRPVLAALVLALAFGLLVSPQAQAQVAPSVQSSRQPVVTAKATVTLKPALEKVLVRVNQARKRHGRKPLRVTACLTKKVAQPWATHLAKTGDFEHQDLSTVFATCPALTRVGENIAMGHRSAKAVMKAWLKSPGHRRNILDRRFRKIGLGLARDADGTRYWVQDFGR